MTELSPHTDPDARKNGKCGWTKTDSGNPCRYAAGRGRDQDTGLCSEHYASWLKNNDNATGNSGGGAPVGNDNAATHRAYMDSFRDSYTDDEESAYADASEDLQKPDSAKQAAIALAADLLMKYQRAADPRFAREFRQVCEAFNIAPADELSVEHEHEHVVTDAVDALRDARSMAELEEDVEAGEYTVPSDAD